jgi:glycosyltransferase involved in cell wall biosynthesis
VYTREISAIDCPETMLRMEGGRRLRENPPIGSPLVSIITVVFNAVHELSSLIENVHAYRNDDIEFIVIDGGSKDGTVELLCKCNSQIDYWLSEADRGIYDAMNKGLAVARGEYLLHLNAGDRLQFVPTKMLKTCLVQCVDVATFSVLIDAHEIFVPKTGFLLRLENPWHHQGTFYRRTVHPGYDTSYRVFGDMNLNQQLVREGKSVRLFESVVANHRNDGISTSGIAVHEIYRSIRANFGVLHVVIAFVWFKYKGMRERVRRLGARMKGPKRDYTE